MKKYKIQATYITRHYDDASAEHEAQSPASEMSIEDLKEYARELVRLSASDDEYFRTMTMDDDPSINVDNEYIDILFDFTEGDFTTDIRVSFVVED